MQNRFYSVRVILACLVVLFVPLSALEAQEVTTKPALTLNFSPNTIPVGGTARMVWVSSGATSCTASGDYWSGQKRRSGTATLRNVKENRTYTMTCTNQFGTTTRTKTLKVDATLPPQQPGTPTSTPPIISPQPTSTPPIVSRPNPKPIQRINDSDRLATADPNRDWKTQGWNLLCNGGGAEVRSRDIPATGVINQVINGKSTGMTFVTDTDPSKGKIFKFAVHESEQDLKGKQRCEIAHTKNAGGQLPKNEIFWHTFSFKGIDWVPSKDSQIVAQWHVYAGGPGDGGETQNPFLALTYEENRLKLSLRYNTTTGAPKADNKVITAWTIEDFDINKWHTFVFRAKRSLNAADKPFFESWVDGVKMPTYQGLFGYNVPDETPYVAKVGFYHFVQKKGITWPATQPLRELYYGKSLLVRDPAAKFTYDDIIADYKAPVSTIGTPPVPPPPTLPR